MKERTHEYEPFLFLHITEECNIRCVHCYMGKKLELGRAMPLDMVRDILSSFRILYGHYKVYLLGGEPTLHPHFAEVIDVCREEGYKVVLTTNGLLSAKAWKAISPEKVDCLAFSFDGSEQLAHEAMRGKGTYPPLLKNIRRAIDEGYQTRLIHTLTTQNIDSAFRVLDAAETLGADAISYHYYMPTGFGGPEMQVAPKRWMEFCNKMDNESQNRRINIVYPPTFIEQDKLYTVRDAGYNGCPARNIERVYVHPDGKVLLCNLFLQTNLNYGTFKDGQIIPKSDRPTEMNLVSGVSKNCKSCLTSTFCKAGCAAFDHFRSGIPSKDCSQEPIPICPLWTRPAGYGGRRSRSLELR